jgi:hypothetical protein
MRESADMRRKKEKNGKNGKKDKWKGKNKGKESLLG